MATFMLERKIDRFDKGVLRPIEKYVDNLYRNDRPVEAFYLSATIVSLAVRIGILRPLLDALQGTLPPFNPIRIVASIAVDVTRNSHAGIAALPAAASIIALGRYLELDLDFHKVMTSEVNFRSLARTAYEEGRRQAATGSPYIASGLLAAGARLAALENDEILQQQMLLELDGKAVEGLPLTDLSPNFSEEPVAQLVKFAQKHGYPDTAVALGLIRDRSGPGLLSGSVVPLGDPTYLAATKFLEAGNIGAAAHLFDTAIDNVFTPKKEIAKILQRNETMGGGLNFSAEAPPYSLWSENRRAISTRASSPVLPDKKSTTPEKPPAMSRRTTAPASSNYSDVNPALPRTLNAWIDTERPTEGRPFHVDLMIGNVASKTIVSAKFAEPNWGNTERLDLLITLSGLGCDIEPAERRIELPKIGDGPRVRFAVTPDAAGPLRLSIRVYLAKQLILLQSQNFMLEVSKANVPEAVA